MCARRAPPTRQNSSDVVVALDFITAAKHARKSIGNTEATRMSARTAPKLAFPATQNPNVEFIVLHRRLRRRYTSKCTMYLEMNRRLYTLYRRKPYLY